jgi:hypothetical protein
VDYNPNTNEMYLQNEAGTGWLPTAVMPGSSAQVSNNQCTLLGTGSSFSTSGNSLTLSVALTFAGAFTGLQNTYLLAASLAANSGWVQKGTWTP